MTTRPSNKWKQDGEKTIQIHNYDNDLEHAVSLINWYHKNTNIQTSLPPLQEDQKHIVALSESICRLVYPHWYSAENMIQCQKDGIDFANNVPNRQRWNAIELEIGGRRGYPDFNGGHQ